MVIDGCKKTSRKYQDIVTEEYVLGFLVHLNAVLFPSFNSSVK